MEQAAICGPGVCWSDAVVSALLGWVVLGLLATFIVHVAAVFLRDHTFPVGKAYGVSWVYGPLALLMLLLLRRDGRR